MKEICGLLRLNYLRLNYIKFIIIKLFCISYLFNILLISNNQLSANEDPKKGGESTGEADISNRGVEAAKINPDEKEKNVVQNMPEKIREKAREWRLTMSSVVWSFIVVLMAYIFFRMVSSILEKVAEQWTNTRLWIKKIIPIFRIFGWTFIIYFIIAVVLAPPIETLVAVTASAGIAIGFASQDILKNVFGGLLLLMDHPFHVGDKIQVGNFYGEVIQIGLRTVRIVTADDSTISIPNNEIVNQAVSNANSGEFNCMVVAEFYLPLNIDLQRVKAIAMKAAAVSRYVYLDKPISVTFKNEMERGNSLLKMRLKAYVMDLRYEFPFMSDMTELVIEKLVEEGMLKNDSRDLGDEIRG